MESSKNIWYISILLSAVAGYCDTVTFVAADAVFSAHVTGNFILFAYQIVKHTDATAWIKLLTFPVFVLSVIVGGRLGKDPEKRYNLLFTEGLMLLLAGGLAALIAFYWDFPWGKHLVAMITVAAMGLQNAFGKLYAKETFGPTTMMTGNVTQASLDLGAVITSAFTDTLGLASLKKSGATIFGFLGGCIAGAVLAKYVGLHVLVLPGFVLLGCYLLSKRAANA
ncbi:DUF1275 domain-containing protein [Mucilaginibacter sp. RS28]|uniref:DUF1275 domain-containing protein n=1 Tax=Mucilaginibacter straminoryzae TaxID=2932774 RepID=A0A9X1WZG8_9SPHI|nr:YoaK family protein [Mucilaginibacter straminoryzae]MCJ8208374.1 DUF1275 domain-containing protein [Mucilaginibacter straminoryzae]